MANSNLGTNPILRTSANDGDIILLESQDITTATTNIDFTSGFSDTYKHYFLTWHINTITDTASAYFIFGRISTDGGSTFISTGYEGEAFTRTDLTSDEQVISLETDHFILGRMTSHSGTTTPGGGGWVLLSSFRSSGGLPAVVGRCAYASSTATVDVEVRGHYETNTGSVDGLRIFLDVGDISDGQFQLYGMK